jgi:hypothetical protein
MMVAARVANNLLPIGNIPKNDSPRLRRTDSIATKLVENFPQRSAEPHFGTSGKRHIPPARTFTGAPISARFL